MANEVKLTLAGDSKQLERAFERAVQSADEAGQEMQKTAKRFDELAERWDDAETRAQGFRDGVTGVQDSVGSLSALLQGDFQNGLLLAGSGFADLSSSLANSVLPSLKATITSLGATRTALLGVAGAASIGLLAFTFAELGHAVKTFEDDISHAQEDLERFFRTGRETATIRNLFGELDRLAGKWEDVADATELWRRELDAALVSNYKILFTNISPAERGQAQEHFRFLDEAFSAYIDATGNAAEAEAFLRAQMGDTNYERAVAAGLLSKTQDAIERTTERTWDQADSVRATAAAYREAAREVTTFNSLIQAQTNPILGLISAQQRLRAAERAEIEAIDKYGAASVQAEEAAWERRAAELALVDAIARTAAVNKDELIPTLQELQRQGLLSADTVQAIADAAGIAEDKLRGLDGARITVNVDYAQRFLAPVGAIVGGFRAGGVTGLIQSLMSFHDGGVVPGPAGQEVAAILQAGERVIPLDQAGTGQSVTITINSAGSRLDDALAWALARSIHAAGGDVQTAVGW